MPKYAAPVAMAREGGTAMPWAFETEPEFLKKLDWIEDMMRDEVEPVSYLGIAVGPTEAHKVTVAKRILRDNHPTNDLFPAYHLLRQREAAQTCGRRCGSGRLSGRAAYCTPRDIVLYAGGDISRG